MGSATWQAALGTGSEITCIVIPSAAALLSCPMLPPPYHLVSFPCPQPLSPGVPGVTTLNNALWPVRLRQGASWQGLFYDEENNWKAL